MPKKIEQPFERIIRGTEEQKAKAKQLLQEAFNEVEYEDLKPYLVEQTREEREIIDQVVLTVDEIVKRYGGKPKPFPKDKIFVLRPGGVREVTGGELGGAFNNPIAYRIVIDRTPSKLEFALTLAHELLHLRGYKSAQVPRSGGVAPYRSGVVLYDLERNKEFFSELEEAIVTEITYNRVYQELARTQHFQKELLAVNEIKKWILDTTRKRNPQGLESAQRYLEEIYTFDNAEKILNVLRSDKNDDYKIGYLQGLFGVELKMGKYRKERRGERERLYRLLDEIVAKSGGKFKSRDDIFEELARANFTGNIIGIGRIIEETLGRGSFRRLAEEFAETIEEEKSKSK